MARPIPDIIEPKKLKIALKKDEIELEMLLKNDILLGYYMFLRKFKNYTTNFLA